MTADTQVLGALVGLFNCNICLSWHSKNTGVPAMDSVHSVMPDGTRIAKQHVMGTGTDEFEERSCFSSLLGPGLFPSVLPCHTWVGCYSPREASSVGMGGIWGCGGTVGPGGWRAGGPFSCRQLIREQAAKPSLAHECPKHLCTG